MGLVETALRQGQQTLLLSRLRTRHAVTLAAALDRCNLAALDVFGGATFEAGLRFLAEDPFARLREIKAAAPTTPLLGLLRGQALTGHRQVPDDVVDAFVRAAADAGLDIFRCYDSLNDTRNLERICAAVHAAGRRAEGAMIYSESPVHSVEGFVVLGERLAEIGYDTLCVYDPAGLLGSHTSGALVSGLRQRIGLPVTVHSAALTGQAGLAYAAAVEAGVTALDVALGPLAGGSSMEATEALLSALRDTPAQPTVDPDALRTAVEALDAILPLYRDIADPAAWRLDTSVLRTQLPPTAVEHLLGELRARDSQGLLAEVQREIPRVRAELGHPPLITPIAQIVATQAVYNVCDHDRYATISQEVKDYCLGLYGEPPGPIDPEVRRLVIGREEMITCRPADVFEPAMAATRREMEREGMPLPADTAVVMYALFPAETAALLTAGATAELLGDEAPVALETADADAPPAAVAPPEAGEAGAEPSTGAEPAPPATETRELRVEVDGQEFTVRVTAAAGTFGSGSGGGGGRAPLAAAENGAGGRPVVRVGTVTAPMQGLILKVPVKAGDTVAVGDVVAVLEAMKMQNDITATTAGTVTEVFVEVGAVVSPKDPIVQIG